MKKYLAAPAILFVVMYFGGASLSASEYKIKFGLMEEGEDGNYYVSKETTDIPLKTAGLKYGYSIEYEKGTTITVTDITHLPMPAESVSGTWNKKNESGTVLQGGPDKDSDGYFSIDFSFTEGDPAGLHKMEIFINGNLERLIEYNVIE